MPIANTTFRSHHIKMFFILEDPDKFLQILLSAKRASRGVRRGGRAHPLHKVEQSYIIIYNYMIK